MRPFFLLNFLQLKRIHMDQNNINEKLKNLSGWTYNESIKSLQKEFPFKSYLKNIGFVNAVAWIANKENHHPDLEVSFNRCKITLTTHDAGGVSEKDFSVASLIDSL
jgi:4a-hydroxytetrahydrobiopterin dehydratase